MQQLQRLSAFREAFFLGYSNAVFFQSNTTNSLTNQSLDRSGKITKHFPVSTLKALAFNQKVQGERRRKNLENIRQLGCLSFSNYPDMIQMLHPPNMQTQHPLSNSFQPVLQHPEHANPASKNRWPKL